MVRLISESEALAILDRREGDFWDDKAREVGGAKIQKIGCSFANADGGEFGVGIKDRTEATGIARWEGFGSEEDGNYIHQALVHACHPAVPYLIDWLEIDGYPGQGVIALVTIHKSASVHKTDAGVCWRRRGAQDLKLTQHEEMDLSLSKGAHSYEDQSLRKYAGDALFEEPELIWFLEQYSPPTHPRDFARKQGVVDIKNQATVAAAVMYAEEPPALIPRKCAIKVARYETSESEPKREHLAGTPLTIEGPARIAIERTLDAVMEFVESMSILEPDGSLVAARYPPEALKEIVVNAVIHRDYNISDDIHVWVFDNRIEVRSPGVLPGHITLDNILKERAARNPLVVRLLNKYPNPPNKDIGEGLNTAFQKMAEAKLTAPRMETTGTSFVVTLGHTPLARPEEIVMDYLTSNSEIKNKKARELTGIQSENTMKNVFLRLAGAGQIEKIPGASGATAAWRKTP